MEPVGSCFQTQSSISPLLQVSTSTVAQLVEFRGTHFMLTYFGAYLFLPLNQSV